MRDIHCPKDIGFNNIFVGEDCKKEQWYDNCYHCWSSAIAENNQEYFKRKFEDELEKIKVEILDKVSMYEDDFLIEPHFVEEVINKRISELKKEEQTMEYNNEMVDTWINQFKASKESKEDAIASAKGTIGNERVWMKGSDTHEQIIMHEQNIANLEEYIKRLNKLEE